MKVALISTYRVECGIATYTDDLGQALRRRGHDVHVLAMELDDRAQYYGRGGTLPYRRCWTREGHYDPLVQELARLQPDVVHVQHEYGLHRSPGSFVWLLHRLPAPWAMTCHTVPIPGHDQAAELEWLPTLLQRLPAYLIAHQRRGAEALGAYGCQDVRCIPHGSAPDLQPTPQAEARQRLGLPAQGVLGCTLGFWTPGKRNDITVTALYRLIRSRRLPEDFTFVFAGQPMGKEAAAQMSQLAANLEAEGLADRIRLRPGFVDESMLANYLGAADFVVCNSGATMYSISGRAHMVMSYGAPVLAVDVPLLEEFHECGLVARGHAELENGIERLTRNPELRLALSQRARAFAAATSWDTVAAQHETLYREMTTCSTSTK